MTGGTRETGDDERAHERAGKLLPEEAAAGSDDRDAQAAAVLAESDERQSAGGDGAEHRSSDETVEP